MQYFLRHLHVRECQLDELWTFIAKKEARLTPLEKLAAISGDTWGVDRFQSGGQTVVLASRLSANAPSVMRSSWLPG